MKPIRILAVIGLCSVGLAAAAAADPRGGASLAAPGACAQPDPELTTQRDPETPQSVSGPPTDDFSPVDLVAELAEKTATGIATDRTANGTTRSTLGTVVDGVVGGGGSTGGDAPTTSSLLPEVGAPPSIDTALDSTLASPLPPSDSGDPLLIDTSQTLLSDPTLAPLPTVLPDPTLTTP